MNLRVFIVCFLVMVLQRAAGQGTFSNAFVNFETAPVHPMSLSPSGQTLAACNLADGKLELFNVGAGNLVSNGMVPVGMDPVTVRFKNNDEAWVINQISDSISVVDVASRRVMATVDTLQRPADVVFAGSPMRAFVSCSLPNTIQVFDPSTYQLITNIVVEAERPRALAVSPDGQKVYAAIFESGNGTTIIGAKFRNLLFFGNAVSQTNGPYSGQNPPPNLGNNFEPPLNPALPTNMPPPLTGIIVRKNQSGRWLDDNAHDWTEFVSGTNAALTQRVTGWDLPDRDLAIIDTTDFSIGYATGLMNQCMAVDVNPVSGRIAVIGTDAINEVRFEPNLNGIFVRIKLALVEPGDLSKAVKDLNPHLDYTVRTLPASERDKSIGDPRVIVWSADGTRGYVAGMGSRNVVVIDSNGNRIRPLPIEVGGGPCGLALDEARQLLYVLNRFSSSISVVDTSTETVINSVSLFDPTPITTAAGRRHLYDTRRTSGLGQAACASCHPDGRMDRLGWDLGNPAGAIEGQLINLTSSLITNNFHPMKGVMVTQTLQDIMGHEPFHWRGDRASIEAFNGTFTNLQASPSALSKGEMRDFREFLASIRLPPNRYRQFDNSLSTNVPLPGHVALGENLLLAGAPLPNGNAVAGLNTFNQPVTLCTSCHTLPTGLGRDTVFTGDGFRAIPLGTNGEHHFLLANRLEGPLPSKVSQFRNLADKIGMDGTSPTSRAGFGFGHDGSVDSLTRFLNGVRVIQDRQVADLIAFLLSVSGSDIGAPDALADLTPPAAVGRQLTLNSPGHTTLFEAMLALARSPTSRVDLIAKGKKEGLARGWFFDRTLDLFQSDRKEETISPDDLLGLAQIGSELTLTVVPRGSGLRLGIDRDLDGSYDRDELDAGTNPVDRQLLPKVLAPAAVPAGTDLLVESQIPPLPAAGSITWWKNGERFSGETNVSLGFGNVSFAVAGDYSMVVTTPFLALTSAPVHVSVVPLLVNITPNSQAVYQNSNALFAAVVEGVGPFQYGWLFNGESLANTADSSLVVSNAQLTNEGSYRVIVANSYGAVTSGPVNLGLLISPALIIPPLSQSVVEGGDATFSFMVSGYPPPFGFQLRKAGVTVTNYTSAETTGFLNIFNVQPTNAGTYRVVITNAANPFGLVLDPVSLTVLLDSDHDGLPDEWESRYQLATNNAADRQLDADLDGQLNWQEYIAGTNPRDTNSYFKIDSVFLADRSESAVIEFQAASNKTYTVQYRDAGAGASWMKAADLVALPTNHVASVTNRITNGSSRFYRLVTPRVP